MRQTRVMTYLTAAAVTLVPGCPTDNPDAPRPMPRDDSYFVEKGQTLTGNLVENDERLDPPGTLRFGGGDLRGNADSFWIRTAK